MGPPSHCYACAGWGWILGDIGVDLSPSDDVISWLRLKPPWSVFHVYIGCIKSV
jgi:hypothetical protein